MNAETSQSSSDSTPLPNLRQQIENAVSELVPMLVQQSVAKEEERRFRQLKWIAAFIGLLGLGTFGTLANFLIEKAVDTRSGNIRETLELTRINGLALKLNLAQSFSPYERDEAIALLMRIAKLPAVKSSPDVRLALTDVLRSFTSAGLAAEVDQLFRAYEDEILVNVVSSEILLHHYGQAIVSRATTPSGEDFALRAFEKLERVAAGHDMLELALAYRLLHEIAVAPSPIKGRVKRLLLNSTDLPNKDAARFLREILIRTRVDNWQNEPTPEGKNFERIARSFFQGYEEQIIEVYGIESHIAQRIASEGVNKDDARAVSAAAVSKARRAKL